MQRITMITMLLFVLLLYFVIIRPQRKREERFALMAASVKPDSRVYAAGGICGEVIDVRRDSFIMVTSPSKTVLELDSDAVEQVEQFDIKLEKHRQKSARKTRNINFR